MIALPRADVRRFRAVARRCTSTGRPRGPAPPVRLTAQGDSVTLAAHVGEVVVALNCSATKPSRGSLTLSMADLEQFEGTGAGVVTLELVRRSAVTAHWDEGGTPRTAEIAPQTSELAWPEEPERLVPLPSEFLAALHEAGRSTSRDPGKYAVQRIQLQGKAGRLIGTDGKQALVQDGFEFPFTEDVLVPAVPVFGAKELAAESDVKVGLVGEWLCVATGPWRVWLAVDREGRFPDVVGAVPRSCSIRVEFDDRDAEMLVRALSTLPGNRDECQPVTLDLGPTVVIRASDDTSSNVAEVPLLNTVFTGSPVRMVLNRAHLGRALALGFRQFRSRSAEQPVVAVAEERTYLMAVMSPLSAVLPREERSVPANVPTPTNAQTSTSPTNSRSVSMPARDPSPPDRNGHADPPPVGDLTDPLTEAEALRSALVEASNRAARLVASLRQYRKERRTLQTAWSSLRQLNLG